MESATNAKKKKREWNPDQVLELSSKPMLVW
jgi:hypothetical protein